MVRPHRHKLFTAFRLAFGLVSHNDAALSYEISNHFLNLSGHFFILQKGSWDGNKGRIRQRILLMRTT